MEIAFAVFSAVAVFAGVLLAGFVVGRALNLHGEMASTLEVADLLTAAVLAPACLIVILVRARRRGL